MNETSLTLAIRTPASPVPGLPAVLVKDLFCMHAPAVHDWITRAAARSPKPFTVIAADPGWLNPGDGTDSVTVPLDTKDSEQLAEIRAAAAAQVVVRRGDLQAVLAFAGAAGGTALGESPPEEMTRRLTGAVTSPVILALIDEEERAAEEHR